MNLSQTKLTRGEWNSVEIKVDPDELEILHMLLQGYDDLNVCKNNNQSLFSFLKLTPNEAMTAHIYTTYFVPMMRNVLKLVPLDVNAPSTIIRLSSADRTRIDNYNLTKLSVFEQSVYECVLLYHLAGLVHRLPPHYDVQWIPGNATVAAVTTSSKKKGKNAPQQGPPLQSRKTQEINRTFHYYTLTQLMRNHITSINTMILRNVQASLDEFASEMTPLSAVQNAKLLMEQNPVLLRYLDRTLYSHQRETIVACKRPGPKLLYLNSPTATGKTVTPLIIAARDGRRVIFVCAARHVGLALARSAIAVDRKIAFAFGCTCAEDVRLHYAAASVFTKDRRSGGIRKVDNTAGERVEIIISDVASYIYAMYYMMAFTPAENIVTWWDEPTITLDYNNHALHPLIHRNWVENQIPNFVLSSFTLPNPGDVPQMTAHFMSKFPGAQIVSIHSHESLKSIPLIDPNGYVAMPHQSADTYTELELILKRCEETPTLLRYIDLQEAVDVILYALEQNLAPPRAIALERIADNIADLNMTAIKMHYLLVLRKLYDKDRWMQLRDHFRTIRTQRIPTPIPGQCGVYVSTRDAHTLTDGPTLFIVDNVEKLARFCIQQCEIPTGVMAQIQEKINKNAEIAELITACENKLEDAEESKTAKSASSEKKKEKNKDTSYSSDSNVNKRLSRQTDKQASKQAERATGQLHNDIKALQSAIKIVRIDDTFVPNTLDHLNKWAPKTLERISHSAGGGRPCTSVIDSETVIKVMQLSEVDNYLKVLLLIGIGVLMPNAKAEYTEIVKQLADSQKLYLILANGDYVYGTNYQHCHGYIAKDAQLSQEKSMQGIGRIGRMRMQQDYTVRFRDMNGIRVIFQYIPPEDKPEVVHMNALFSDVDSITA